MILFEKKRSTTPAGKTEESRFDQIRKTAAEKRGKPNSGAPVRDRRDEDDNLE